MIVLAKVTGLANYADLEEQGFARGVSVPCSQCDVDYRIFYSLGEQPGSVQEAAASAPSVHDAVEKSHPEHPNRIEVG